MFQMFRNFVSEISKFHKYANVSIILSPDYELTKNGKILWSNLSLLLQQLTLYFQRNQKNRMSKLYAKRKLYYFKDGHFPNSKERETLKFFDKYKINLRHLYNRSWDLRTDKSETELCELVFNASEFNDNWENEFNPFIFKFDDSTDTVVKRYCHGLQFGLHYYIHNTPPSKLWHYPYHFAPELEAIVRCTKYLTPINVEEKDDYMSQTTYNLCVQPYSTLLKQLPSLHSIQSLLTNNKELFESKIDMEYTGKKHKWEGTAKVKFPSFTEINRISEEITVQIARSEEITVEQTLVFIIDELKKKGCSAINLSLLTSVAFNILPLLCQYENISNNGNISNILLATLHTHVIIETNDYLQLQWFLQRNCNTSSILIYIQDECIGQILEDAIVRNGVDAIGFYSHYNQQQVSHSIRCIRNLCVRVLIVTRLDFLQKAISSIFDKDQTAQFGIILANIPLLNIQKSSK